MTSLTLSATSLNEQRLSQPITARFDAGGGTIGRADHNTMALPDPERYISRVQAEIVCTGDGFLIRNVGAKNPIDIAGRSLAQGESSPVNDADTVRVGGYLMEARLERDAPSVADDAMLGLEQVPATESSSTIPRPPRSGTENPFADLLGQGASSATSPFSGLFGDPAPPSGPAPARSRGQTSLPPPAGVDARSAAFAPGPPAASRLPDDFDVFAPAPAPPQAAAAPPDPFADLGGQDVRSSIDEAFGLDQPGTDDLLTRFASPAPPGAAGPAGPAAQRDDLPALHGAYEPPRALRPRPDVPPPQPPAGPPAQATPAKPAAPPTATPVPPGEPAQSRSDGLALAMWRAFCEGAGVDLPLPSGSEAEQMRRIGRILRSAIEGTIRLIAVRASTRLEFGAQVTMIRPTDNNPLKFSPDATSGIEQLLRARTRGFLDGPAAMDDAMRDLVGHSVGSMAGMRAAMEGMFDRFDPEALEERLGNASRLDSWLPMNRRARLWELYLKHHAAIRDAAQDDFQALFGKAFLAAYEQQVEQLAAHRDAKP